MSSRKSSSTDIVEVVETLYPFNQDIEGCLKFDKGEKLEVFQKLPSGWWLGRNEEGKRGWFPSNFILKEQDENTGSSPKTLKKLTPAEKLKQNQPVPEISAELLKSIEVIINENNIHFLNSSNLHILFRKAN
jgi:hypothetical protein